MKFLNIEFAPLQVPLQRRLQTLAAAAAVTIHVFNLLISTGLTYYLLFHTRLWLFCSLYLFWIFLIDTDPCISSKRRSRWVRNWIWWKYVRDYFPIKLVKVSSMKLDATRNYLFCYFPHGLLSHGLSVSVLSDFLDVREHFPDHTIYCHTLSYIFYLPFLREMSYGLGTLPASIKCLENKMGDLRGGNISCLVIGGAEEAFYCNPGVHKVVLKKRKGFIKIALRNGCPLVPVYGFGENEIYGQYEFKEGSFMKRIQKFLKDLTGVAFVVPKGRGLFQYTFGIVPHRREITVVVGEPIDVQKTENPTQEQIDNLHQLFEKKLVELFESQKKYYLKDYETAHLEIC